MKKKTMKKWSNRLMKSAIVFNASDEKIKYISSKQLGRLMSSKEFKNFFYKYKGFKIQKPYLHFNQNVDADYSQPLYDRTLHHYMVKTKIDMFDYTLIIDNPSREYIHLIKNRKFYLKLYNFDGIPNAATINMVEEV